MTSLAARSSMSHITAIRKHIEAIRSADDFHVLVIEGPAGWGKTTTVEEALKVTGIEGFHLGAYSTPLNLFNFLAEHSTELIVIDDCAGLFHDSTAMAILKAATWPSRNGRRMVKWGSTSSKSAAEEFEFAGKLVIVCNSFPKTPDADAIRSRGFSRRIEVSLAEAKNLILHAAEEEKWFDQTPVAKRVAVFLMEHLSEATLPQISFRTLKKGYRLAEAHPNDWQDLFRETLPQGIIDPQALLKELAKQDLKVKDQARIFEEKTGLKKRSFYNYRKGSKLSTRSR